MILAQAASIPKAMGVYTHNIPFLSFLNYLSYTPGFISHGAPLRSEWG